MFQREEISLKIKIYLVLVFIVHVFSRITTCGSAMLKGRVGEKAQLDFPYPCDSAVVTLQHANQRSLYRSANPQYKSLFPNQILVNYTETGLDQCFLNLTINPVSRVDEGTYILTAYKNGTMLPDYPRIYLGVDYPPGKATCEKSNDYNDGEWVSLQCTAPVGTLPGQIVCYQNGIRLPKINELRESDGKLNQLILARLEGLVYCCSSILTGMKDKCECTDWRWDLMSDSISDIADPCPQVMSTEDPTSTYSTLIDNITSSPSNLVITLATYPENNKKASYFIVVCSLLVIFVLTTITLIIKYCYKAKELAKLQSSSTPEKTDSFSPAYMYAMVTLPKRSLLGDRPASF